MQTKSALSWFGSDGPQAHLLGALFDDASHVTITCAGGLSILPFLKAKAIVANDLHADAINYYRVSNGPHGKALRRLCALTLSHPDELRRAAEVLQDKTNQWTEVDRAWAMWAACWVARKGHGGTSSQQRGKGSVSVRFTADGGNNASRLQAVIADLEDWADQFKRCEFTQLDSLAVLDKVHDREDCGVYHDPDWFDLGKGYLHTTPVEHHEAIAARLATFKNSPIVVRYGDCPKVRSLYPQDSWCWYASSTRTQNNERKSTEVWITRRAATIPLTPLLQES